MPPPIESAPHSSNAAQLGFASIALGGILSAISPVTFMLIIVAMSGGSRVNFDRLGGIIAAIAGYMANGFVLVLCFIGIWFGIKSMLAAKKQGESAALGFVGAALSVLAFFAWVGIGIAWFDPAYQLLR
ncbi:MAG TPA: hypothetical protein VKX17_09130 [Planctomycetota bacterium]|nr:hypothetical protein [Planctomycetota bacterium]